MVTATAEPTHAAPLHPAHAFFLSAMVPLFLGAVLSDYAYTTSYQVQWVNFAIWLIAGGLVFAGFALLCEVAKFLRADRRRGLRPIALLVVLVLWVLGLIDAFVHSRDAFATMPTGFVLSIVVFVLACIATWLGFTSYRWRSTP
ncbi:membrane protein [Lysobacter helvus]|uniref:Membrane protein n=2 Tax=Lysobacteraceae TaxID=32033 RepID=A0ABM7Q3B5_9GAMM|nr:MULTISPECIES: DUF2231 domain-containing protein [Lysobacter]BCT91681.1 membrane protein [Lysobacter caseinilyticus]BCT94834.1 membrane protein [Lysobacter helvus]